VARAGPAVAIRSGMTRLQTIATRQKKSFARDVLFALLVATAAVISVASLRVAIDAATLLARQ